MNTKSVLATAALAGLLMGVGCSSTSTETASSPMGECHGINSCKGTGACGGEGHSCAGQNKCKGQGWLKMSKTDCEGKKGTFKS
jgi:uncharacterized membrane protein